MIRERAECVRNMIRRHSFKDIRFQNWDGSGFGLLDEDALKELAEHKYVMYTVSCDEHGALNLDIVIPDFYTAAY